MPNANGKQTWTDIAHRIGIWSVVVLMAVKLFSVGAWVGAADEKFKDAASVEVTQKQLVLTVNTLTTEQKYTKLAVEANKVAIEESKDEILAAIKKANGN